MIRSIIKSLIIFIIVSQYVSAQGIETEIGFSQKGYTVKSTTNSKSYQLYVSLPSGYDASDTKRYPVLYVLDAYYSYPMIISLHNLFDSAGEIEKIIIVAIGDENQFHSNWIKSRTFDYTPSNDPIANKEIAIGASLPYEQVKSGGAELFLDTMRNDIIPFIEARYNTTKNRGITGHSLGGLFTGYCLLNANDLFSRFGINSPSFLWGNAEIVLHEKLFSAKNKKLKAKVFISMGSNEHPVMFDPINSFISGLQEHAYNGLSLTKHVFHGETHMSVVPASFSRTLMTLYGTTK